MKHEIEQIKDILEEHLAAINENTAEIQSLFDYLHSLDVKVDKMIQRLDLMQINQPFERNISPLNQNEKKVFLVLYTAESPLNVSEVAARSFIQEAIAQEILTSLISKGIPMIRSYFNSQLFLKLDPQFKELQAKENLLNLSLQSFME
ncbi:MAG TPA: hypothetical protein VJC39_02150 [Candidatus Nanoarchaeia archaeon]|nr:hypothetical protein [Candidatus Nanoarchaeia archaeon]